MKDVVGKDLYRLLTSKNLLGQDLQLSGSGLVGAHAPRKRVLHICEPGRVYPHHQGRTPPSGNAHPRP